MWIMELKGVKAKKKCLPALHQYGLLLETRWGLDPRCRFLFLLTTNTQKSQRN